MENTGTDADMALGLNEAQLTEQEKYSRTSSAFSFDEDAVATYQRALRALNAAGVRYVVSGAFATFQYTGIFRDTKDLDLFLKPEDVVSAAKVLKTAGFTPSLSQAHWLAKATRAPHFLDLIYGLANGLGFIDEDWHRHSRQATLFGEPVRIAPPEEMIWHRLFISERHRYDMADVVHIIWSLQGRLDWQRLERRAGEHWPLLLTHLILFRYVYPEYCHYIPAELMNDLLARQQCDVSRTGSLERVTRGTLISLFSFQVDVNEWGFKDLRQENVAQALRHPVIQKIAEDPLWEKEVD